MQLVAVMRPWPSTPRAAPGVISSGRLAHADRGRGAAGCPGAAGGGREPAAAGGGDGTYPGELSSRWAAGTCAVAKQETMPRL